MGNRYRTTIRPVMGGGIPDGVKWSFVEAPHDLPMCPAPRSRHRYGVIETDRPLTRDELYHFDIIAA